LDSFQKMKPYQGGKIANIVKPSTSLVKLYTNTSTHIDLPTSLATSNGQIQFKYEKHDIQAAFSGGAVDLRNTLAVGTKIRVANFWKGDHLSISVVKHNVNPDMTQDVDFKVRLDRGGDAMVFAHVASNYFTLKGSTFCGRSASHVVFDKVVRPLLEKKMADDVKRKEVQEEEEQANAIIDLTDMDNDLVSMDNAEVEDLLDRMYKRGGHIQRKQEKRLREEEEEDCLERHHSNPAVPSLAARLHEIFPQVPLQQVQQRCHDLLDGREDFGAVEHVFERLTVKFLHKTESFGKKRRKETGTMPTSSDSAVSNLVDQIVKMEDQQATVKVEVKTEEGVEDAMQEVSNDPPPVGAFKSQVKEENEYKEAFGGIFLQAQGGTVERQVKEEMIAEQASEDDGEDKLLSDAHEAIKRYSFGSNTWGECRALLERRAAPKGAPIRKGIWKPSQQLAELLGISTEMKVSKASVLRMLWVRLEKHKLLDLDDNRFFTPDEAMSGIFGALRMRATHMEKCVRDHLVQDKD